ncbi:MAG: leucine-rich repeat domain-containing protein [Candidatus Neomarinimicrobiota bacterium]|nr:leucine-rich repeat domain-containing protein [Candidatus Neomarinimicrobiota bacterium]
MDNISSVTGCAPPSSPQGNGANRHRTISTPAAEDGNKLQRSESLPDLPDPIVTNILSFHPNMTINKGFSESLLKSYKETIVKRLDVKKEMVDALERSDIIFLFNKLNKFMETDHPTALVSSALTMGFSLKQIMSIPSDQLSEYKAQFDAYVIPADIQNQIDNLSETNDRLNLYDKELTTGQLCKILNALTDAQRGALTYLDLTLNQLTSLPDSFRRLTALTKLDLYCNQLSSLPDSFGCLTALAELYLYCNQLTSLPHSFGNLSALTNLVLASNRLTSLPDSFGNLTALTQLTLETNRLISLPDSFGRLTALTYLNLRKNQLTSLPDSFGDLSALTQLDLDENQLKYLPDSFGDLSALRVLVLRRNKFNTNLKHAIQQRFNFAALS